MMKLNTLVYVKWVDSTTEGRWTTLDDLIPSLEYCETVGWLIRQTKDLITVAGTRSEITHSFVGVITIPKCAIKMMKAI